MCLQRCVYIHTKETNLKATLTKKSLKATIQVISINVNYTA